MAAAADKPKPWTYERICSEFNEDVQRRSGKGQSITSAEFDAIWKWLELNELYVKV